MTGTRRRGDALEAAIFEAALDVVGREGLAGLTMERVAREAQTGKAALYRRWDSTDALLGDALIHVLPKPASLSLTGDLRSDLVTLLECYRGILTVSHGAAFQVLKEEMAFCQDVIRTRVMEPLRGLILETLRRGAERGEVRPEAVTRRMAQVGPAALMYHFITDGGEVPADLTAFVVDEVLVPAVRLTESRTAPDKT